MDKTELDKVKIGDKLFFSSEWFIQENRLDAIQGSGWAADIIDKIITVENKDGTYVFPAEKTVTLHYAWLHWPNQIPERTECKSASQEDTPSLYCSCSSPQLVENTACWNTFKFCTVCRKERI